MTFLIRFDLGGTVHELPADIAVDTNSSSDKILGRARKFLTSVLKDAILLRVKSAPELAPNKPAFVALNTPRGEAR